MTDNEVAPLVTSSEQTGFRRGMLLVATAFAIQILASMLLSRIYDGPILTDLRPADSALMSILLIVVLFPWHETLFQTIPVHIVRRLGGSKASQSIVAGVIFGAYHVIGADLLEPSTAIGFILMLLLGLVLAVGYAGWLAQGIGVCRAYVYTALVHMAYNAITTSGRGYPRLGLYGWPVLEAALILLLWLGAAGLLVRGAYRRLKNRG